MHDAGEKGGDRPGGWGFVHRPPTCLDRTAPNDEQPLPAIDHSHHIEGV